jgi:hypothetical protein
MSALLEYECRVPVDGYDVVTIETLWPDAEKPYKVRMLQPRSNRTRRFDLFDFNSSAFLEFAQTLDPWDTRGEVTPLMEDRIKHFADRYGPLDRGSEEFQEGWWIRNWAVNMTRMHQAVKLWRKSKVTGDFSGLIPKVEEFRRRVGVPVNLLLKKDPLSASARLCIRPHTLLHALWAQLVLAIDGNLNLRACVQCRKWFTIEAGRGRSDKEYCSNACRMRAYRKRKGSAVEAGNGSGVE